MLKQQQKQSPCPTEKKYFSNNKFDIKFRGKIQTSWSTIDSISTVRIKTQHTATFYKQICENQLIFLKL